jgi:large subunit ribosomal protein L6
MRALLANAVLGVTQGWSRELEIQGVGFRAESKGSEVHLALGYSHPVVYRVPDGVKVEVDRNTRIVVSGADRQQVGQVAAEIRKLRKPDVYKGKGIRYKDERLKLKIGKAGAG